MARNTSVCSSSTVAFGASTFAVLSGQKRFISTAGFPFHPRWRADPTAVASLKPWAAAAGSTEREAIQKTGNSCPLGWVSSGSYCIKSC